MAVRNRYASERIASENLLESRVQRIRLESNLPDRGETLDELKKI